MADLIGTANARKRRFPSALQVVTTIYGLLYLILFIDRFVTEWDLETIFVKLLFILFLVGYFFSWKNGGIAGLIFLFWFILVICEAKWVETILHRDSGMTGLMAIPLLVIGVLFIISWYEKRRVVQDAVVISGKRSRNIRNTDSPKL